MDLQIKNSQVGKMSSHDDPRIPELQSHRDIDRPPAKRQRLFPPVVQSDFRFDTIPVVPVDSTQNIHCNIV